MGIDPFQIFSDGEGGGTAANLTEMVEWMMHHIDDGEMDARQAIEMLIDIVRPGQSENSHDVKPIWTGAMWAFGFGHVASQVHGMFLNTTPWGFGFAISVEKDFQFEALSDAAKEAVVKSLLCVIRVGGLNAEITDEGTIRIDLEDGTFNDITTDDIVGQFRREIEEQLGPDAPDDPMRRWMP